MIEQGTTPPLPEALQKKLGPSKLRQLLDRLDIITHNTNRSQCLYLLEENRFGEVADRISTLPWDWEDNAQTITHVIETLASQGQYDEIWFALCRSRDTKTVDLAFTTLVQSGNWRPGDFFSHRSDYQIYSDHAKKKIEDFIKEFEALST